MNILGLIGAIGLSGLQAIPSYNSAQSYTQMRELYTFNDDEHPQQLLSVDNDYVQIGVFGFDIDYSDNSLSLAYYNYINTLTSSTSIMSNNMVLNVNNAWIYSQSTTLSTSHDFYMVMTCFKYGSSLGYIMTFAYSEPFYGNYVDILSYDYLYDYDLTTYQVLWNRKAYNTTTLMLADYSPSGNTLVYFAPALYIGYSNLSWSDASVFLWSFGTIRFYTLGGVGSVDWNNGYQKGVEDSQSLYDEGRQAGYLEGIQYAQSQNSTALTIFTGIINIALLPINFFLACLNFEVFGINIGAFVSALLTIAIVVIIIRMLVNGGNKE